MSKMIVWTEEAEYYFRHVWPGIPCKRIAGEEATYAGEKISENELRKPESVAHEWLEMGWIKYVDTQGGIR